MGCGILRTTWDGHRNEAPADREGVAGRSLDRLPVSPCERRGSGADLRSPISRRREHNKHCAGGPMWVALTLCNAPSAPHKRTLMLQQARGESQLERVPKLARLQAVSGHQRPAESSPARAPILAPAKPCSAGTKAGLLAWNNQCPPGRVSSIGMGASRKDCSVRQAWA